MASVTSFLRLVPVTDEALVQDASVSYVAALDPENLTVFWLLHHWLWIF